MKITTAALTIGLAIAACTPPKTAMSMRAWRLAHDRSDARSGRGCRRACPIGEYLTPITHSAEDCCYDVDGLTWSTCAWNGDGRYLTAEQLLAPERLGGNCGTDGFPDCK